MTTTIAKNAERGAEFLDEHYGPEWDERIDLERLDLGNTCNCVLGQIYQSPGKRNAYYAGLEDLGIEKPSRLGFDTWGVQTYTNLTAAWRRLIERRRKARAA